MENYIPLSSQKVFQPLRPGARRVFGNFTTTPEPIMLHPFEYSGWRNEVESWKKDCYIHAGLNPHATARLEGPDVLRFFSDYSVNSFQKFSVGAAKHTVLCNQEGYVFCDGVLLRTGEQSFEAHGMLPVIQYPIAKGKYEITLTDISRQVFNIQLGGPRSLEIVEAAAKDNLHDIRFCRFRDSVIAGLPVRVLRLGMSGTLGYEIHGKWEDFFSVYEQVLKTGKKYGLRQIGVRAYTMTHWENGYPQASLDYPWAMLDEGHEEFLKGLGGVHYALGAGVAYTGSMGTDPRLRWKTPFELGWGHMVKFDHDFLGRAALEKEAAAPRRKMVTLEWNTEDICDVYRSQFETGEPYQPMDEPEDFSDIFFRADQYIYHADQVLSSDGKLVGISSGRMVSASYRKMISLCSIDVSFAKNGEDVIVVWGEPGKRQKKIRAKVARFPYLDELRNEKTDVSRIPYGFCGKKKESML